MNTRTLVLVAAVAILAGIGARALFPKTETDTEIVRLPTSTDTVQITDTVIQRDTALRTRIDSVQTTDTLVLADTVWQTDTVRITRLEPRWYVDSASFGQSLQDSSYIATTWLAADSSGIYRRDAFERQVATPGPVQSLTADAEGVSVDFGQWPEPPNTCGFGCRAQWGLGGASLGVLTYLVFGP